MPQHERQPPTAAAATPHRVRLRGHVSTVWPVVRDCLWRAGGPPAQPWSTVVEDPRQGSVRLTGWLREQPGAEALVVLVHGLGGSPDSGYVRRAAAELARAGYATLALALRGADRRGDDFYNIALTDDLHAAIASAALRPYRHVLVLGFSMGGHVSLHLARAPRDPRVRAVAALCTPLDLKQAQLHIDAPHVRAYCRWVLNGLKDIYAAVAARRPVPSPVEAVLRVRTIYEWDTLTIAPRYGYRDPDHYYRELSIAPHLDALAVPSLLVLADDDPIVSPRSVLPFLPRGSSALEVRCAARGGHVAFPRRLDLGAGGSSGLVPQLARWFARHCG